MRSPRARRGLAGPGHKPVAVAAAVWSAVALLEVVLTQSVLLEIAPTERAVPEIARAESLGRELATSRLHRAPLQLQWSAQATVVAPRTHRPRSAPQQQPYASHRRVELRTHAQRCPHWNLAPRRDRAPRAAPKPCPARTLVLALAHPRAPQYPSATAQAAAPALQPAAAARQSTPAPPPRPPAQQAAPGPPTRLSFPTHQPRAGVQPNARTIQRQATTGQPTSRSGDWLKSRLAAAARVIPCAPYTRKRPENRAFLTSYSR